MRLNEMGFGTAFLHCWEVQRVREGERQIKKDTYGKKEGGRPINFQCSRDMGQLYSS
jgi:hypothetical protein